jgi:hypothetical protein
MRRGTVRILAVLAAGALGACGDDGLGPETELTEAEAAVLAEAVMQAAILTTATNTGGPQAGPARAPFSTTVDVSFTAECPLGGTVDVAGEVHASGDDETGEGLLELSVEHKHHGCVVESEDGTVFTFEGSPQLEVGLAIEFDGEEELGWSGAIGGGVEWSNEELAGRCNVDLAFDGLVSGAEETLSISVEGTVCRQAIDLSWSLALGTL